MEMDFIHTKSQEAFGVVAYIQKTFYKGLLLLFRLSVKSDVPGYELILYSLMT